MSFDTNGADAFDPITGQPTQTNSPEGVLNHQYDPTTGRLIRTFTTASESSG